MKFHIHITTQGWLPQDPYIPSNLKVVSNKHRWVSKAQIVTGSTLLFIGLIAFMVLLASVPQNRSLTSYYYSLESNHEDRPFSVSYDTHGSGSLTQPLLECEVVAKGDENVEFTVNRLEQKTVTSVINGKTVTRNVVARDPEVTNQVICTTVNGTYSFNLPVNVPYEFIFQNTNDQPVKVGFDVNLTWKNMGNLMLGLIVLLVTAIPGTLLIVRGHKSKSKKATFQIPLNSQSRALQPQNFILIALKTANNICP
jgi:hypothetical protein